jgi:hypothetical protein
MTGWIPFLTVYHAAGRGYSAILPGGTLLGTLFEHNPEGRLLSPNGIKHIPFPNPFIMQLL